jgi:hypothetical protein
MSGSIPTDDDDEMRMACVGGIGMPPHQLSYGPTLWAAVPMPQPGWYLSFQCQHWLRGCAGRRVRTFTVDTRVHRY